MYVALSALFGQHLHKPIIDNYGMVQELYEQEENKRMKGITKDEHGLLDFIYVPAVLAAPKLADFEEDTTAAIIARSFAGTALVYTLMTDAKWGAIKLIPYKTHAILDLSSGILAAAVPAVFNIKSRKAKNTFFLMAITGLTVGILSIIGASKK
jgi:hypothetical protein